VYIYNALHATLVCFVCAILHRNSPLFPCCFLSVFILWCVLKSWETIYLCWNYYLFFCLERTSPQISVRRVNLTRTQMKFAQESTTKRPQTQYKRRRYERVLLLKSHGRSGLTPAVAREQSRVQPQPQMCHGTTRMILFIFLFYLLLYLFRFHLFSTVLTPKHRHGHRA